MISLNQNDIEAIKEINAKGKKLSELWKPCIVWTPEVVIVNRLRLVNNGQGEGDTKWKGWAWKLLLIKLDIEELKKVSKIKRCYAASLKNYKIKKNKSHY